LIKLSKNIPSPIYKSPTLYHLLMLILYNKYYKDRFKIIADEIPEFSTVIDVCAGDAYIYLNFLKKKSINYFALDNSPYFYKWAKKRGVNYYQSNVLIDEVPKGDIVIMMASLYQFIPDEQKVLSKIINAAKQKVIISEPVSNLSSSSFNIIAKIANQLSFPFEAQNSYTGERFDKQRLNALFTSFPSFQRSIKIPGGREIIGLFSGKGSA
jgi:hypothetical protein